MSDLISRQAAIEELERMIKTHEHDRFGGELLHWTGVKAMLDLLPSAQPERPEQPESAREYCTECNHIEMCRWYPYEGCEFRSLPSAQPEIIKCKDCKHFEYDHPYIIQGMPVLGHEVCNAWGDGCKTDENGYCFMAERKDNG